MPAENDIAFKFAEAIHIIADACNRAQEIEEQLNGAAKAIARTPELTRFLASGEIRNDGKTEALEEIFSPLVDPILIRFMQILQAERLTHLIPCISGSYAEIMAAKINTEYGQIVSAVPLNPERIRLIQDQISSILHKQVSLAPIVNPDMIGGCVVKVGDFCFDGSVEKDLARSRDRLIN